MYLYYEQKYLGKEFVSYICSESALNRSNFRRMLSLIIMKITKFRYLTNFLILFFNLRYFDIHSTLSLLARYPDILHLFSPVSLDRYSDVFLIRLTPAFDSSFDLVVPFKIIVCLFYYIYKLQNKYKNL